MRTSIIIFLTAILGIYALNHQSISAKTDSKISNKAISSVAEKAAESVELTSLELGPEVGKAIPHDLVDVNGEGGFEALSGENGIALFFVRSLDWCPYCKRQAIEASERASDFEDRGLELVFVSYDSADKQKNFAERTGFSAAMLSDTDIGIINAFGLRNEDHAEGSRAYGIPHPAVFIVGKDKTITAKIYEEDYTANKKSYRNRPAVDVILEKIDASR